MSPAATKALSKCVECGAAGILAQARCSICYRAWRDDAATRAWNIKARMLRKLRPCIVASTYRPAGLRMWAA